MVIPTSVYTASHGYSWSNVPEGLSLRRMNGLYRIATSVRNAFDETKGPEAGIVCDGTVVGAFTIQKVEGWDSEGRAADYAAFAFYPVDLAGEIDVLELFQDDYFWTLSREPRTSIDYTGPKAAKMPPTATRNLQTKGHCVLRSARAVGSVLAAAGHHATRWTCLADESNGIIMECSPWRD